MGGGEEGTETGSRRESRVLGAVLSSAGAQPGPGRSNDCLVHLSISCLFNDLPAWGKGQRGPGSGFFGLILASRCLKFVLEGR